MCSGANLTSLPSPSAASTNSIRGTAQPAGRTTRKLRGLKRTGENSAQIKVNQQIQIEYRVRIAGGNVGFKSLAKRRLY